MYFKIGPAFSEKKNFKEFLYVYTMQVALSPFALHLSNNICISKSDQPFQKRRILKNFFMSIQCK